MQEDRCDLSLKRRFMTYVACWFTLAGRINPGRVFDFTTNLDGIAEAYAAMDGRRAIKSLVRVGAV